MPKYTVGKGAEVDWREVERIMERGVTQGNVCDEHSQRVINAAYKADPERYGELHRKVKDAAITRMRAL